MSEALNNSSSAYIPGVCNINPAEVAKRRKAGHFGLVLFIVLLIVLVVLSVSRYIRIILFVPAFISAIGYLQAKNKFCVGYASAGSQHADDIESAVPVTEAAYLEADKKRTKELYLQAAIVSLILMAVTLVIPHV
jgi:predicted nucleic acid-binding Zn ribbon protein